MRIFPAGWSRRRKAAAAILAIIGLALALELGLRLTGILDFPLYRYDPVRGYSFVPNQAGRFLDRNRWAINDRGFVNDRDYTPQRPSCFLVGDSIVYGGNPVDMDARVTALAQRKSGRPIWTLAAGGWNIDNTLMAIDLHRAEIGNSDRLVLVLNSGDFISEGKYADETAFPTRRPPSALAYVIRRYVLPSASDLPAIRHQTTLDANFWGERLRRLVEGYRGKIAFVLYADLVDLRDKPKWQLATREIRAFAQGYPGKVSVIDIAARPDWTDAMYRDGVHPNDAGNRILAGIVADQCAAP